MKKNLLIYLCLIFISCNSARPKQEQKKVIPSARLIKQLDSVYFNDQYFRCKIDSVRQKVEYFKLKKESSLGSSLKLNSDSLKRVENELSMLFDTIQKLDKRNTTIVTGILDEYGWLGPDEIGKQGNATLFLVIQHAYFRAQEKYLPMMREAVKSKKANPWEFALLVDRVEVNRGRPQIYGSQIEMRNGKYTLSPIKDEINVNKRRAEVGLQPLEEYVKHWNITYKLPKRNKK